ncbi:MAG: Dabb family protein [Halioglobus sp.]
MLQHTVVFRLKHPRGSTRETEFLAAARSLSNIKGVEQFQCLRQVSDKSPFDFGLSMFFADESVYQDYNADPDHAAFVEQRWMVEVDQFMEIDYLPLLE